MISIATPKDPTNDGAFQNEIRVVGSNTTPLFIEYQRVSNVSYGYGLADGR